MAGTYKVVVEKELTDEEEVDYIFKIKPSYTRFTEIAVGGWLPESFVLRVTDDTNGWKKGAIVVTTNAGAPDRDEEYQVMGIDPDMTNEIRSAYIKAACVEVYVAGTKPPPPVRSRGRVADL